MAKGWPKLFRPEFHNKTELISALKTAKGQEKEAAASAGAVGKERSKAGEGVADAERKLAEVEQG